MKPATAASQGTAKLAELLRSQNLVNEQQLSAVLRDIEGLNVDLPFILEKRGLIGERDVAERIAAALNIPLLEKVDVDKVVTQIPFFPIEEMERYRAVPVGLVKSGVLPRITLAMSNPFIIEQLLPFSGRATFALQVAPASEIRRAIKELTKNQPHITEAQALLDTLIKAGFVTETQLEWAKETLFQTNSGKPSAKLESNKKTNKGVS